MGVKKIFFTFVPALIACALLAVAVVPSLRDQVQRHFSKVEREVLATAEGDLLGDGSQVKALKIRSDEGIFVEVFKAGPGDQASMVDRILLPDKLDGLFNYQGHVTRLAIADIDGDGKMELLAPSFDKNLVPHMNVFHYNPATGKFELYQPPQAGK